jgi:hypothetical protein
MKLTEEKRSTRGKTCLSATLSTINPTGSNAGLNPDLRGERPATNRLSHGTALVFAVRQWLYFLLCFCAVSVTGLTAVVSARYNKQLNLIITITTLHLR